MAETTTNGSDSYNFHKEALSTTLSPTSRLTMQTFWMGNIQEDYLGNQSLERLHLDQLSTIKGWTTSQTPYMWTWLKG